MSTRMILGVVVLGAAAGMAGGCGPTKSGIEARTQAQERMNLVTAQIHFDQARQSFQAGQFDKATREIEHAIAIYPKSAEYYVLQGRINLETHKLEPAVESFKTAMETDPKQAEAHYYSGVVYQRWSDDEEAYGHYLKASELEPSKAQYLLAAAESLIALGEFEAAKQLIEPKMAYFEHNAAMRQLQGQIALLQGQPQTAAALYAEARLLNPDDDRLLEELMWAQYAAEMYGQCHESIKRLQTRAKEQRTDLMQLEARCLTLMNRSVEGRELYLELAKLRPSDVSVWSELGALAWDLGDYRRVASCSAQIIALAPQRYEGYMLKGINERQKNSLEEAVNLFRQAAERSPDVALPHLLLGQTLEQTGDMDGARLAYNQAATVEPNSTEATTLLRRLNESQRFSAADTD